MRVKSGQARLARSVEEKEKREKKNCIDEIIDTTDSHALYKRRF